MFGAAGLEELLKLQMTSSGGSFSLIRADSSSIQGCVQALEEERRKIEAFKRELPMCMQLIADAIQALKNHSSRMPQSATSINLGCDAATTYADDDHNKISSRKCFAEFIPSKSDEKQKQHEQGIDSDKPSWMSQAQLWTQSTTTKEKGKGSNAVRPQAQRIVLSSKPGAFSPFIRKQQQQQPPEAELTISSESQTPHSDESEHKLKEATSNNSNGTAASKSAKARRCWSPELHRRFMDALKQLGGSQATPKQIREIMKVDGLTNDEVKSHLQKYRLHTRRPTAHSSERQVVVLNGIWVPPEIAAAAAAGQRIFDATSTTSFCRSALSQEEFHQKPKEEQEKHEAREEVITKTTIHEKDQEQQRDEEMEDTNTTETEEERSVREQQTSSMDRSSEEAAAN